MAGKTCARCKVELAPIRVLDATERANAFSETPGAARIDLTYVAEDATESFWSGITPDGVVRGYMCPTCNRITLYGEPRGG